MPKQGRHYQVSLAPQLASQMLDVALPTPTIRKESTSYTLGERLNLALEDLSETIRLANKILAENGIAKIVAASLAKDLKKRGEASIVVTASGEVVLQITSGKGSSKSDVKSKLMQGKWHSELPSLDHLRQEAEELGVDISGYGRKRREIHHLLETSRQKLRGAVDEVHIAPLTENLLPRLGSRTMKKDSSKE